MGAKYFDDIFEDLGHLKLYQVICVLVTGIVIMFPGYQNFMNNFMAPNIDYWCHVTRLRNLSQEQQKYIAIPPDGTGYSKCQMFDLDYANMSDDVILNWNRSAVLSSGVGLRDCEAYDFDRSVFTYTIREQYGLVCSREWMVPLVSTVYLLGHLIGAVSSGCISDRYGRKTTLLFLLFVGGCAAVSAAFSPNYILFVTLRLVCGACGMGSVQTSFVLLMESVGPRWRLPLSMVFHNWFALGFAFLPGVSYLFRNSFHFQLVSAAPAVIYFTSVLLLVESPRWLMSQGRYDEAKNNLERMAKMNGTNVPDDLDLEMLHKTSVSPSSKDESPKKGSLLDLFRTPGLRKRTFIQCLNWFATSLGYYGLSLSAGNLPGSVFINSFILAVVQFPGNVIIIYFVFRFGRRPSQAASLILAGACLLFAIPFAANPELPQWVITASAMFGKMFITASFAMVYLYSGELYPTVIRANGVGLCSMSARAGSMISPQLKLAALLWPGLPFLVFGVVPLVAGLLSLKLPETKGIILPETLEEGEYLGRKKEPMLTPEKDQKNETTKL